MPKARPILTHHSALLSSQRALVADLALLIGGRLAAESLLSKTTPRHLANASRPELEQLLPPKAAERLFRLLRFAKEALMPERPLRLDDRAAVYRLLYPQIAGVETERFFAIAIDSNCRVLAVDCVAQGSPNSVEVRPADVFAGAVRHRAVALICAHNHPSASLTPSPHDLALTERLLEGARFLGIDLLDHVILTTTGSGSIRDEFEARGRAWKTDSDSEALAAGSAPDYAYDEPVIRLTERQHDQLLGHLDLLALRVRHLRDEEGRSAPPDAAFGRLLSEIEDFDLLDDQVVLETHSFLRGFAAGLALENLADLDAYAANRAIGIPEAPGWVQVLTAAEEALALLRQSLAPEARELCRHLRAALAAWRRSP